MTKFLHVIHLFFWPKQEFPIFIKLFNVHCLIFSEYMYYTSTGHARPAENTLLENIICFKKKGKIKLRLLRNWIDCEKATPFHLVTLPTYSFWFMFINLKYQHGTGIWEKKKKKHKNYINVTHTRKLLLFIACW